MWEPQSFPHCISSDAVVELLTFILCILLLNCCLNSLPLCKTSQARLHRLHRFQDNNHCCQKVPKSPVLSTGKHYMPYHKFQCSLRYLTFVSAVKLVHSWVAILLIMCQCCEHLATKSSVIKLLIYFYQFIVCHKTFLKAIPICLRFKLKQLQYKCITFSCSFPTPLCLPFIFLHVWQKKNILKDFLFESSSYFSFTSALSINLLPNIIWV